MNDDTAVHIDEEALRQVVLKAYHERRESEDVAVRAVLEAVREFLSGDISDIGRPTYRFEDAPRSALDTFSAHLEATSDGLAGSIAAPLLAAFDAAEAKASPAERAVGIELAPNPALWLAALAGPIALRHSLDETVVSSALAATALAMVRLGARVVRSRLVAV